MRKQIHYVFIYGFLLISCSKNNENPKEDIIQLQKVETELTAYTFTYNEKDQLSKIDIAYKKENGTTKDAAYVAFIYENELPVEGKYYVLPESGDLFTLKKKTNYSTDVSKRIASIANINYWESGVESGKDTIDFFYNQHGQITGRQWRALIGNEEIRWEMNEQGNLIRPNLKLIGVGFNIFDQFENRYDNAVNPFNYNSLGLLVYSMLFDEIDNIEALFSKNNPVYSRHTQTTEYTNDNGQVVNTDGTNNIFERTLTYNDAGTIISSKIVNNWQMFNNGVFGQIYTQPNNTFTYHCVMKQQ